MTDLELTKRCAEAFGLVQIGVLDHLVSYAGPRVAFAPLRDDAHMARLVKHFHLHIDQRPGKQLSVQDHAFEHIVTRTDGDLNRAVCELVAML